MREKIKHPQQKLLILKVPPGPLFRQPCNQRLQALSHLAGTFEEKTMQND